MMNDNIQDKTNATEESFWSMLSKAGSEFSIYIPRIQRDYAQGRLDAASTQIREKFVDDIFDSLVNHTDDGQVLDVNFIYGNVEEDAGHKNFVPIDGQQRLTTLFLVHWYFAVYSGKIDTDPEVKKRLLQFQYETRNVTGQFCRHLTEDVRIDLKNFDPDKKVSDAIRNYYWFFSDFENDSSIRGMLVMLDAIHAKAMEYTADGVSLGHVFDLLTSDHAPIRFLYLNIDDVGLTDSIYIKMNARGKALTHFENFKAQLRNYLSDDEDFANEFIGNINGRWSEFFWTPDFRKIIKDKGTGKEVRETSFDSQMMKFFRFIMLVDYIIQLDDSIVINSQKKVRDSLRELNKDQDYVFTSRLFKDGFQHVYGLDSEKAVLSPDTFRKINTLLNILSKRKKDTDSICFVDTTEFGKSYLDETRSFLRLIGTSVERALTLEEQVILFAEYAFLIRYANDDNSFDKETELNRWLRLVYNLVKPTLNLQLDIFFGMIRSLNQMIQDGLALNCNDYMSRLLKCNYRKSAMSVFTETQVNEESIKAILMKNDPAWKEAIADSENTFMDGQTGALFSFTGLTEAYSGQIAEFETEADWDGVKGLKYEMPEKLPEDNSILSDVNSASTYYASFQEYLTKFKMLFDTEGVKKNLADKTLLRRALLCYGGKNSYMLPPGKARQSFLDNTDRDYGFRRLLRDDNGEKRSFLKLLMDDMNVTDPVENQLQNIIDQKTFTEDERWKRYFVQMPEILGCTAKGPGKRDPDGHWVFATQQRFIRRNDNDDILLLTRTQTNSVNRELYSYVLFLKARKMGLNVRYHADYTDGAEKYAVYMNKQDKELHVVYKRRDDETGYVYIIKELDDTEVIYYDSMESTLDYIKKTVKADDTGK